MGKHELSSTDLRKDIREQKPKHQTASCLSSSFSIQFSKYRNGLDSIPTCMCGANKQDNHFSINKYPLSVPEQSKNRARDISYELTQWYVLNFQWIFGVQLIGEGGIKPTKLLGDDKYTLLGFQEKIHKDRSTHRYGRMAGKIISDERGSSNGNKIHTIMQ